MSTRAVLLGCILYLLPISMLQAAEQSQLQAISRVGELNGLALQCGFFEQVEKIKVVLIRVLPKRREFGEWFEYTTHKAYMEFIKNTAACPGNSDFEQELELAFWRLEQVFLHHE